MSEPETQLKLPKGPGRNVIPAAEAAAWNEGFAFLAETRSRGREILREARRDARAMRQQGFREGRDSGVAASTELLIKTRQQVEEHFNAAEDELIKLAMSIVHQVLGEFDPGEVVGRAAANALKAFASEKLVRVTVNPAREDGVRAVLERLGHEDLPESIMVLTDPAVELDDCIVSTDVAQINAGVAAQLKAISAAFDKAHEDVDNLLQLHLAPEIENTRPLERIQTIRVDSVHVGDDEARP